MTSDGTSFLACTAPPGWYIYHRVIATRITAAGQVLDSPPIQITDTASSGATPHASFDGTNWIVGWSHPGIRLARITPSGSVLDPGGVEIDFGHGPSHSAPHLAPVSGGGAQVVWGDARNYFQDVFTARVNGGLSGGAGVGISLSAPRQDAPRMAGSGSVVMLVYRSTVAGESSIKATLLDEASGGFLLPEPITVATSDDIYLSGPAVAWDGSRFLVVWTPGAPGSNQIYGRRYLADGTPLDASPIFLMDGLEPDVAALDGTFLVVGTKSPGHPQDRLPYSIRVRGSDGAVLGSPTPLGDLSGERVAMLPRIAPIGNRWLVVWQGRWTHNNPWACIKGNYVDASGQAGTNFVVAEPQNYNYAPSLAVGGGIALVTFQSSWNRTCCWDIYGCRFDASGAPLDPPGGRVLVSAAEEQSEPAVAWDGEQFVVVFQDRGDSATDPDRRPDLYGVRVLPNGTVLDPNGFEVAAEDVPEFMPALFGPPQGSAGGGRDRLLSPHSAGPLRSR